MDLDDPGPIPTQTDIKKVCSLLATDIRKLNSLKKEDETEFHTLCQSILESTKKLEELTEIDGFSLVLFGSDLYPFINSLISIPDTEISAIFLSILTDLSEKTENIERLIKEKYIITAIKNAESIDEINIQSDAQYLYSIFNLISTIIDGCEEPKAFIDSFIKDTILLKLIERQFQRDDFDQNVLAASELLAIILQSNTSTIALIDDGFINLILRFCANMHTTKQAEEDEAASNAFNIVIILAMDPVTVKILANLGVVDILLQCTGSSSHKTEKSSALLAYNALDACLSTLPLCCEQFVDADGIQKVFGLLGNQSLKKNFEFLSNVISIIDSLLSSLQKDSTQMKRVLRKFQEKDYEKMNIWIKLTEYLFKNVNFEEEDQSNSDIFDTFLQCCSSISILMYLLPNEAKVELASKINESMVIDYQLVIDSALELLEQSPNIKDRVEGGIKIIELLCKSDE
ncbi:hypothetical protein TVAG_013840 [Trichomonas vaginalis G3]|uniref:Beta-catenin-like protein 1 N-terminal domain-containing protein n=1 Tax=Trichomonas vaginalis (strain ATCC PRA-98 / G3) TaxID=412133 RepID=A2DDD9_TRIV3|nr:somatic diversification of immunoglobulins [Trichomonas vaginalis G3]EAY21618.1 hypothetical protein TVAG_013840 [Trichomonas vaginalis G3]KAI5489706.1 somatic diversification of immunoglobulins [Trichomonas vaginalis G3]|eukprot:XP_001582604.1 hypothetical protein [Trichomonas vaginalis G3]